jgi:hypothetical protein
LPILNASDLVVLDHDRAKFQTLRRDLINDIQPVGAIQVELFNQALRHAWTVHRCDAAERDLAAKYPGQDPLLADPLAFNRINRTRTQSERAYRQALAELRKLQTDRAVRQLKQNQGLVALPVLIDSKTYIRQARAASGIAPGKPIHFPPYQAALDQFVRDRQLGENAYDAWQKRQAAPPSAELPHCHEAAT